MEEITTETPVEEQSGSGTANLPLAGKDTEKCVLQGDVGIGIGEDDIRALPAQLE